MAIVSFNIPPRSRRCCMEKEEFSPGTEYFSQIEEGGDEGYTRQDFCVSCWEKRQSPSPAIYWKASVPLKKAGPDLSLKRDERALQLLKEIHQNDDEEDLAQAFILTLLLARNKLLILRQEVTQEDDGKTVLLYEVADTEEMLCVRKVDYSSIDKEQVQQRLAQKLSNE